jgi:cytoskeleton protein RodZ
MSEVANSGNAALGARLSEARQAQSLATADVARRLKLSVAQVEALEAGRFDDLPGPVFVRGFIRNYAKLVKLDPDELLQAAADSLPQVMPRPEMPPSPNIPFPRAGTPRWPRFAAVIVVIVGALAVYEFVYNETPTTVATGATEDAPVAAPPAKEKRPARAKTPPPAEVAAEPPTDQPAARTEAKAPIAQPSPAEPAAAATAPATPVPPVIVVSRQDRPVDPDEREVRFVFEEDSWVEVRDRNDTVIFYQLNASGTVRRVSGLPPLTIVVGNANGVKVTYAGKPVDLARHTKIDVARLTLE